MFMELSCALHRILNFGNKKNYYRCLIIITVIIIIIDSPAGTGFYNTGVVDSSNNLLNAGTAGW